jgi:LmbE family N-acetylglucosaminyl deacetylase
MMKPNKRLKILFFTPHPDDIEIGCPFMYYQALARKHNVVEIVMTNGEFGTLRDAFKGSRLAKIRAKELTKANRIFEKYAKHEIKVVRMGYVDGYLPFKKSALQRVQTLLLREEPTLIFAPDPVFPQDYHPDHVNTGKLVLYSLFNLKLSKRPLVLFYYSVKADFYLKCHWRDFNIIEAALNEHRSQCSPLAVKLMVTFYKKLSIFRHLLKKGTCSESYRKQKYKNGRPYIPRILSFRERLIYYIYSNFTLKGVQHLHDLTPEDVGLDRNQIYLIEP